ncbi:MAG: HAMP domain-containing histidine kinase [Chloroflexota bacterium]|nr:MAG: HAMP domain-containing histidine kinase [Chloroflexota bacterium]
MPEDRPRWRHGPRRRPPWWPADEAWPPVGPDGRPAWGPGPGRWGRRGGPWAAMGCLFFALMLLGAWILLAIIVSILGALGVIGGPAGGVVQAAAIAVIIVGVVAIGAMGRVFGASARTLGALVDVARRLENGDYGARVGDAARGPRPVRQLARAFDTLAERLEADETARQALLADVSHELRTPLAVIRGNLEAIADGVHPADDEHLVGLIEETVVMERLIEDLRTLSLAEAGRLTLHPESTDVDVLLNEAAASFRIAAADAGVTMAVAVPADLPLAEVDPVRIREVVTNLISNAVRHTPAGGSIRVEGAASRDGSTLHLAVENTGPGLDPSVAERPFDRFVRGPGSKGSGLGLAIARDLVEAHGGTISVDNQPGDGTTFRIVLPVGPAVPQDDA